MDVVDQYTNNIWKSVGGGAGKVKGQNWMVSMKG
jgi:hypothetical protein